MLSKPWCEVARLKFEHATSRLQIRHSTTQPTVNADVAVIQLPVRTVKRDSVDDDISPRVQLGHCGRNQRHACVRLAVRK